MITREQLSALRCLIFVVEIDEVAKRIFIYLLDNSRALTEQVSLTLWEGREGYSADEIRLAAYGIGAMNSSNCHIHIHAVLTAMGSDFTTSIHYGHYDEESSQYDTLGQFAGFQGHPLGAPLRYTFWLARKSYGHSGRGTPLPVSREILEAVDVVGPMLYGDLYKSNPHNIPRHLPSVSTTIAEGHST